MIKYISWSNKFELFPVHVKMPIVVILKAVLAIRRIFSLVDMITNTKFSNCPNDLILL